MRAPALAFAALALLAGACKTTTTTSTSVTGTPRIETGPVPQSAPGAAVSTTTKVADAWSPAGKWSIGLVAQGQNMEVTLELVKLADGSWSGMIGTAQFGTIPLSKVTVDGKKMVATFPVPTGDMGTMTLNFDGDLAEGEWSMPGDGSKVSGKRS